MLQKTKNIIISILIIQFFLEIRPEEVSEHKISITPQPASMTESDSLTYRIIKPIKHKCNFSDSNDQDELRPCWNIDEDFDLSSCPPGFQRISGSSDKFCYQISATSVWNFPCFNSGGASVITDLSSEEVNYLLNSLNKTHSSKFFWLPAQRAKLFYPVVWYIPGPNWGRPIENKNDGIRIQTTMLKNCLLLDVENRMITMETCSKSYPSLCFYLNDLHYPAKCPNGYYSFRFLPDNGTCFGIEKFDNETTGMTFNEFRDSKCNIPMGDNNNYELSRFIFMRIAELNELTDNMWCWFSSFSANDYFNLQVKIINDSYTTEIENTSSVAIINNNGFISLVSPLTTLPCMACESEVTYTETVLNLEYNSLETKLYLTIYFPSGLWKYDVNDRGIQCFSDAKGFVRVIDVSEMPVIDIEAVQRRETNSLSVEKVVYVINLITDRSAQYWCEGHTNSLSLVSTTKIVANPQGNKLHVFALVVKSFVSGIEGPDLADICNVLVNVTTSVFSAEKVLIMDILEYNLEDVIVLMHLHITLSDVYEDEGKNLLETYNNLEDIAQLELPKFNITFLNISSSMYCLPTTSVDSVILDWDLASIGQVLAPKQFCLQRNGLPVTRNCHGSYNLGGYWGDVNGYCNENFEPSLTTTFLYNFVKGQVPENYTARFLTEGLGFVLEDIDIIIPADIYYLSMSLQQVKKQAQTNQSSVDMGDIENMAWVMDRVMIVDGSHLRLSQILNSTNVILDSVNDIIEMLAQTLSKDPFHLAIKPQFVVQISYPEFNNITGIAIAKSTDSDKFTDMIVYPLYKNTTLDFVLSIKHLEVATWVPTEVYDTLRINLNESDNFGPHKEDIHIVISIFYNDVVFQQLDVSKHTINSRVIGVTIPGFVSNLANPIPLIFKEINKTKSDKLCAYWDFQSRKSGNNPGFWTTQGCFFVQSTNNLTVCECFHLTHFGQLFDINTIRNPGEGAFDNNHTKALNIITLVGSFLSLLGIFGIWITALLFQTWRRKAGTKVLLQLSTAIALPLAFIVYFNFDSIIFIKIDGKYEVANDMRIQCIILGALLHYSILASFTWMLITAILQFVRYVRVLGVCRPSRFMVKFTLIGWGIPLIPVSFFLAVCSENYIPDPSAVSSNICYPTGLYLILGILVPVCLILLVNIMLFVSIIYAISTGTDGKIRATDRDLVGAQLRLSIFLIFLLGLTWIFGILSFSNNLLWSYLFCLTSTLQGFVLFIYFVICDPATRNLWVSLMKPQIRAWSARESIVSISSS